MQKESSNPRRVYFLYEDGISVWPLIHFLFTQYLTILILRCYHKPYFQFVFFLQSKYEVINIASSNKNKRLSKSFCGIHKTSSFQLIYKCYIYNVASQYIYMWYTYTTFLDTFFIFQFVCNTHFIGIARSILPPVIVNTSVIHLMDSLRKRHKILYVQEVQPQKILLRELTYKQHYL